jgi:hypothetical protein
MKRFLIAAVVACALAPMILAPKAAGVVIVDDSWTDGGRNNGADALDTDWWYSTASSGIEVGTGYLGLVTGSNGRGIHGTFSSQSLGVGDTLTATFTFLTPATVTSDGAGGANFKIGVFDTTGHSLAQDIKASSSSPNTAYNSLNGYMMDFDVNPTTTSANIAFRERSNPSSGQLLASTSDFTMLTNGGSAYSFLASTNYTGVLALTRTDTDTLDLSGSLYLDDTLLSTFTGTVSSNIVSTIGMIAFHANSNIFGTGVGIPGQANNGIDFTNIKIEVIPEPSTLALAAMGLAGLMVAKFRRR